MSIKVQVLKKHPYARKQRKIGEEYFIENPKVVRLLVAAKKVKIIPVVVELDNSEVKRVIKPKVKKEKAKKVTEQKPKKSEKKSEKEPRKVLKKRTYSRKDLTAEENKKGDSKDAKTVED